MERNMTPKVVNQTQLCLFPLPEEPKAQGKRAKIDELVDGIFAQCESSNLAPFTILIEMKYRDLNHFLARLSRNDREQFILSLFDVWFSEPP
jgi:hypothetical protein